MARNPIDTSSISFTALYTGQVWWANGLSAPGFSTRLGSFYYHALSPFEYLGGKVVGGNIRTFLLQRHQMMDHLARQAVEEHGVTQILEIACGLSPRGTRFVADYPWLHYVEADLPDMAQRKRALLDQQGRDSSRHEVVDCNILALDTEDALEKVLARLDLSQPVLVITEGLVNYFNLETISGFWSRLALALKAFPRGIYLTDNYPLYYDMPFYRTLKTLGALLGSVSRSDVTFHFGSDDEARAVFEEAGFDRLMIHNPADYYDQLDMPHSRGNPLVRVMQAITENDAAGE
jgi:O-methyltransferase involved in polyketide biosynthesis